MNANYFPFNLPMKMFEATRFMLVCLFLISFSSYAQGVKSHLFHASGAFVVPAGVTSLSVQTWGAGGGGGGADKLLGLISLGAAGGGGGGGAYNKGNVSVGKSSSNVTVNYAVGLGGAGEISSTNHNGSAGGTTSFPTSIVPFFSYTPVVAVGGAGGKKGGLSLFSLMGEGGEGGIGLHSGGKGNSASLLNLGVTLVSGGGGGGAGSNGDGSSSPNALLTKPGGAGGPASLGIVDEIGGKGGDGIINLANNGLAGVAPGGGGGGSAVLLAISLANTKGGKGGDGQIKINYTCPTYSIDSYNMIASCSGTVTFKVFGNLPIGKYTVTYNRSLPLATGLPYIMTVSKVNEGEITVTGLPLTGLSVITIKELKSEDCITPVDFPITLDRSSVSVTHPSCAVPKGSVVLSGLSTLSTWTITASPNTEGLIGLTGTGSSTTIKGLTPGVTYSFSVSHGGCVSEILTNVVIDPLPPTRTWSGSSWDVVPTMENKAVFATSYTKDESVVACSCEVKANAHVVIKKGNYLKIRNELAVSASGSITFDNNASLVQINDVAENSGEIFYKRQTLPVNRYDYTYWSSPVTDVEQTLKKLSPTTLFDKYYSYDNGWVPSRYGVAIMNAGEGYIIRAPQSTPIKNDPKPFLATFEGKPNNGEIAKVLKPNQIYLLGNPYPSAIDADVFLDLNSKLALQDRVLEGTLYFWTHNTPPSNIATGTETYTYTSSDYATYNKTGGVVTTPTVGGAVSTGGVVVTGKIAAGQGFFAPASAAGGQLIFNNSMRLNNLGNVLDNSSFFKLSSGKNASDVITSIEKSRIWLNLTNSEGAFKQALIGYVTGATNDYEGRFDGVSYNGGTFVDFYSMNNDVNLTIQGRALPFEQKDSVSLGYRSTIKGEFQISIDQKDGKLLNQQVFLEDQLVKVLHDLKTPYSFETEIGTFNDRFVLRYEDKNAIIEDIDDLQLTAVSIVTKDKKIDIKTTESAIDEVYIYDFSGNLVYSDSEINASTTVISNLLVDHSALIVHVLLENGKKTIKKIMY